MDFISERRNLEISGFSASVSLLELLSVAIVLLALRNISSILSREDESAEEFNVALPEAAEPGWKGEILEHPNIKVREDQSA